MDCGSDSGALEVTRGMLAFYGENATVPEGFERGEESRNSRELRDLLTSNNVSCGKERMKE